MIRLLLISIFLTLSLSSNEEQECYSIQLFSFTNEAKNYDRLSKQDFTDSCKLLEVGEKLAVRCGCHDGFSDAKKELIKYKDTYKGAYILTSYKYIFEDVTEQNPVEIYEDGEVQELEEENSIVIPQYIEEEEDEEEIEEENIVVIPPYISEEEIVEEEKNIAISQDVDNLLARAQYIDENNTKDTDEIKIAPDKSDEFNTTANFSYIKPIAIEFAPTKEELDKITDGDGDGVMNDKDRCRETPKGELVDEFGCEIIEDSDKDGIADEDDQCANTLRDVKVDDNGCELDSDNDGVVDSKDSCEDTGLDFIADSEGCPQTPALKIYFQPDGYNISDMLIKDLKVFSQFIQDNTGLQVILYGYADNIEEDPKSLSRKRANIIKKTLISEGVKSINITVIARGDSDPMGDNSTEEGRAKNRCVKVELLY